MTQFPKIHDSLHYNEIVNMLIEGKSGRKISDYLKEEYGETISHTTINKFNKKELDIKGKADKKLRRRSKEKVKKVVEEKVQDEIQTEADIETAVNNDVNKIELLQLMSNDGFSLWEDVKADTNISSEYKMKLSLQAIKLLIERDKDINNLNINLDTNLSNLGDMICNGDSKEE